MSSKPNSQNTYGPRHRGHTISILALGIVVTLCATYGIMDLTSRRTHSAAERIVSKVVNRIDQKIIEVEEITSQAAQKAYEILDDPQALQQLVYDFVEQNSFIYGSTVAFEPNAFPQLGRCYAPYSWKTSDGIVHSRQLGTETDYYEEEWYAETKLSGKEYWCEPYFDEGGAKTMMCTYSIPLKDRNGNFVAILTSDIGLEDLEEYISTITPNKESSIILRSRKGNMLVDAQIDPDIVNDAIFIKGVAEIGWSVELCMTFSYLVHGDSGFFFIVGIILMLTLLFVFLFNQYINRVQQRATAEYMNIIGALTEKFTCVEFVELGPDKLLDRTITYRLSEKLKKRIPDWTNEQYFSNKLDLLIKYLIYQPDRAQFYEDSRREKIMKQLEASDSCYFNFRVQDDNGEIIYCQIQLSAVRVKGKLIGIVAGLQSIDEQMKKEKNMQLQLENALSEAVMANKAKTNFLFSMSHDIRTPMNAITGFTAMAKRHLENSKKVEDYLSKIDLAGHQLLLLVNQVLEMSRIESGKVELDVAPVNIKDSYQALITVLSEQAKVCGLQFNHSLENITHFNVMADDARMSQITLNIVGNAIKYTPVGGTVNFNLKEKPCSREGYACFTFTVQDTGIGMSEEFQKELFEPFSREKSSTVSRIQGTGLGMAIVKNIVDLMNGTIEVKSEPGKGTRFDVTIEFKIAQPNDKPAIRPVSDSSSSDFKGKRVLLVEDNELNREIARFILEDHGLVVEEAEDGDIAVRMVSDMFEEGEYGYYDCILMDIQMPVMDGFEATRAIRMLPVPEGVHVPIVAMTANAFEEDRKNALEAGMDGHLSKPIDVDQLWNTLARFI